MRPRDMSRGGAPRVMTDMHRESELELVAQLRIGDAAAFDRVYGEFNVRLFSFLARLSRTAAICNFYR